MQVQIPLEFEAFVQAKVQSGHCRTEGEVVAEALRLFREVESRREELRRDIEIGMQSGAAIPADVVFQRLEERAKQLSQQSGK